jgi:hypothetical protein
VRNPIGRVNLPLDFPVRNPVGNLIFLYIRVREEVTNCKRAGI